MVIRGRTYTRRVKPALAITLLVAMTAACSSGSDPAASLVAADSSPASSAAVAGAAFPTGPAVLVASDYQAPKNKVDSTGAFLPANGKPTVVWTDAIW